MQCFESCRIFREFFTHPNHRLSQRKRKWILSKKSTGHCFHIADTIDDVVASELFRLPLYMTERLNMFHQSCYSISPIFHWIGLSLQHNQIAFPHWSIFLMQSFKHIVIVCDLVIFVYFDKSRSTVFSTHCHLHLLAIPSSTCSMSTASSRFKILAILI